MSKIERTAPPTSGGGALTKEQEEKIAGVPAGGTTGQVLTKKSNTSYDDEWKTSAGGPPSGAAGGDLAGEYPNPTIGAEKVTEANLKAEAVAAGKLKVEAVTAAKIATEAVETAKIKLLAVTEGLLAAEAVAEAKIKNEAVAKGKLAKAVQEELELGIKSVAMAYRKTAQKIKANEWVRIEVDTLIKDPASRFKTGAAEGWYVTPAEGYYQCSLTIQIKTIAAEYTIATGFYVGGVEKCRATITTLKWGANSVGASGSGIVFAKASEKIEMRVFQSSAGERELEIGAGEEQEVHNRLSVVRVA